MSTVSHDSVIVIGAGPSGLAAAHRLARAGVDVQILDAGDRVGGKLSTTNRNRIIMDDWALFLTSSYASVLSIADELGMAHEVVPGPAPSSTSLKFVDGI